MAGRHEKMRAVSTRRVHRVIGLVMLLPLLGWAGTGAIFFIKPGYAGAYELVSVKTYPLDRPVAVTPQTGWTEVRYVKTALGEHLLARSPQGWLHLDPVSLSPRPSPTDQQIRTLMHDAFATNPTRYGRVTAVDVDLLRATTDTGVRVTLDWKRLTLSQRGPDTDRIDWYYKIHYLQWTGHAPTDRVLGGIGLVLVVTLSLLGAWIFLGPQRSLR